MSDIDNPHISPRRIMQNVPRVIQVIETNSLRGRGTEEDPCRNVRQYWDFEGNMLAESDPCAKEKE